MSGLKTYNPKIGDGIFTIPEAARIVGMDNIKLKTWINKYWGEEYTSGERQKKVINFKLLIESQIIEMIRSHGVSFKEINGARAKYVEHFKVEYPFAYQPFVKNLKYDKKRLFFKQNDFTFEIRTNQIVPEKLIEEFLKKIDFEKGGYAKSFYPLGKDHNIVVDPKIKFGKPIIEGTGIPARIIYDFLMAGDDIKDLSEAYEIDERKINDVLEFYGRKAN